MSVSLFRITEQRAADRLVLKLEGRLSAACVDELNTSWLAAMESWDGPSIWVDLSEVFLVDVAGQEQLTRMYHAGARFVTRGCAMRELVREISESR